MALPREELLTIRGNLLLLANSMFPSTDILKTETGKLIAEEYSYKRREIYASIAAIDTEITAIGKRGGRG